MQVRQSRDDDKEPSNGLCHEGYTTRNAVQQLWKMMRRAYLDYIQRDGCAILVCRLHVSLQIDVQKFKDQVQFLVSMNDV